MGVTATIGAGLTACTASSAPTGQPARPTPAGVTGTPSGVAPQPGTATPLAPRSVGGVLLAYFSRAGENYYYGGRRNLEVGNTEVLARIISGLIDCDVHRIEAADAYSTDYDATVARNVREQEADARPVVANPLTSIDHYATVLLASPIWNVRAPMIMTTLTETFDFRGKTVHPITTYAMSGLGTTERDYATSCRGATLGEGLAVQGEQAAGARAEVRTWLRRVGLLPS
jgi:flavodoxin